MNPKAQTTAVRYIVYDKKSGRILQTYCKWSVEKQSYVEIDIKEITKSLADDPSIRLRLAGGDPKDLGVIKADEESPGIGERPGSGLLTPRPASWSNSPV